jgi:hypothetical protein
LLDALIGRECTSLRLCECPERLAGILILAAVCSVISFLSFGAPKGHSDANWTLQACVGAADLRHRPLSFAVASVSLVAIWLMAILSRLFVE